MEDIKTYLEFSERTLRKAGDVLISFQDHNRIRKTKDSLLMDIATTADYAAEEYILGEIKSQFPDHGILTEETAGLETDSDYRWIIDPLDGTKEYVRHSPYFYTLLALEYRKELVVGAGFQPVIGRMFLAGRGKGITVNGHQAHPSPESSLAKSFISVAMPQRQMPANLLDPYLDVLKELTGKAYRLRSTAWDVEALFNVASGVVEAYVLPPHESGRGPKLWDIASGIAAVRASGCTITDFNGGEYTYNRNINGLVASNGKIHKELITVLQNAYR